MWRVKNIMELSDKYVMKSLCRRAAMAESKSDAALSAVGAFTRLWFRSWKKSGTACFIQPSDPTLAVNNELLGGLILSHLGFIATVKYHYSESVIFLVKQRGKVMISAENKTSTAQL